MAAYSYYLFQIYVIQSECGHLYCGFSQNPSVRLSAHLAGEVGATRPFTGWQLIRQWTIDHEQVPDHMEHVLATMSRREVVLRSEHSPDDFRPRRLASRPTIDTGDLPVELISEPVPDAMRPEMHPPITAFAVYLLASAQGHLYIGQTKDFTLRLLAHNSGRCITTAASPPWFPVCIEYCGSRSAALARESRLIRGEWRAIARDSLDAIDSLYQALGSPLPSSFTLLNSKATWHPTPRG